jgi:hypothetical protein
MWADNETTIDLLGFEYLVDALEVLVTEPRLLPVTVGVAGDWGSGKTSLLYMTEARLQDQGEFSAVHFSPWRYEGYEDIKAALMSAVLSKLEERVKSDEALAKKVGGHLQKLIRKVGLVRLAPAALTIASQTGHMPPEAAAAATTMIGALAPTLTGEGEDSVTSSLAEFRDEFADLMEQLDGLTALVVFVDDLDRCLPPTVVATFEAIRLFLHAPKTAYAIAAHPLIIESAIDGRYSINREGDASLGRDYLEKILQVTVTVPALSSPEVETFINLLFAELHLKGESLQKVQEEARRRREADQISIAMNHGIAQDVLGNVPEDLERDFAVANRIAPVLAGGLRGNPRQIKRFLNTFVLRQRIAAKRGGDLDPAILAKLMILELDLADFERVFGWQLEQEGQPKELVQAEAFARGEDVEIEEPIRTWAELAHIKKWLLIEPALAGVALGRYFYFARDRLSPAAPAARLSGALQDLLSKLQSDSVALRSAAIGETKDLAEPDRRALYEALTERYSRDPRSPAMEAARELAGAVPDLASPFFEALASIPASALPGSLILKLRLTFPAPHPLLDPLLERWGQEGPKEVKDAVAQVSGS